jgi:ORF6N domain-containing protein
LITALDSFVRSDLIRCAKTESESIAALIITARGQKVLLDSDLAALYGVPTKRFNGQVKRNRDRFPEDFMFQLAQKEFDALRSQNATSNESPKRRIGFHQ